MKFEGALIACGFRAVSGSGDVCVFQKGSLVALIVEGFVEPLALPLSSLSLAPPSSPRLLLSSACLPTLSFLVLPHGWVFVTEGFSAVLTVLVFFQEGLNGDVLVGMFHVEMSVYEPEFDCSKGEKSEDIMVSVCFVAMLMPPQVSPDVRGRPCWVWECQSFGGVAYPQFSVLLCVRCDDGCGEDCIGQ